MINAFKAVFWSFFGVRKRSDYEADTQKLKPQHVIAAGAVAPFAADIPLRDRFALDVVVH